MKNTSTDTVIPIHLDTTSQDLSMFPKEVREAFEMLYSQIQDVNKLTKDIKESG